MDTLEQYRQLIRNILIEHTKTPFSTGDIQFETVFDSEQDRYLVMILGREPAYDFSPTVTRRVHGCLIHVDIIDGKIWIQRDGTEDGVAAELVNAGVPKNQIVLGFRSEELRQDSEFAIA
ncbi:MULTISPECIES: XisI protein [Nostoc]|uniref:FdxN element excision controlling factor protein n=1 Tax=Nostoc piscinale CENA21 TaxID=224013 RepID=A0A0M5MKV4_9NOSO|nr:MULTISPECIES: XisI protein [Nostoc]ALF53055.1 FdxN element excision controlling factor protein [Nostoc piscinale CENA21]MBD2493751.1 XisI protein [Nostoc sp. FACHB-280]